MKTRLLKEEKGSVIILLALMMLVILGFAAIAIDVGSVSIAKQDLQAAADAAALAGAQDLPNANTAKSTAIYYAGQNGVQSSEISATSPFQSDSAKIEVICTRSIPYTFAQIFGLTQTTVSARAVAKREVSAGSASFGYAIFSANKYPDSRSFSVRLQNVLAMSGSSNIVNGNIHANYNIDTNTARINGVGEAVGTVTGTYITTKYPSAPIMEGPDFSSVVPNIKAAAIAAGQYYTGNFSSSNASSLNVTAPVYVEGNANLSGISFSGTGCIYVKGKITITGNSTNYDSSSSICMYSGYTSTIKADAAIDFSGSDKTFKGILYAPNGSILVSGSNYTFKGSVVGRVVDVSGSNKTFQSADVLDSFPYGTQISIKLVG